MISDGHLYSDRRAAKTFRKGLQAIEPMLAAEAPRAWEELNAQWTKGGGATRRERCGALAP